MAELTPVEGNPFGNLTPVEGNPFDAAPTKDTVSRKVFDDNVDQESVEKAKFVSYLNQKGWDANTDVADYYRQILFGGTSSYGSINKQLTNELSVEPKGLRKYSAKLYIPEGLQAEEFVQWLELQKPLPDFGDQIPHIDASGLAEKALTIGQDYESVIDRERQPNSYQHGAWNTKMDLDYSNFSMNPSELKRLQAIDEKYAGFAPERAEGFWGVAAQGFAASMPAMLQSIALSPTIAGPSLFWHQQGSGSFMRRYIEGKDIDAISGKDLKRASGISDALGIPYAAVELAVQSIPGVKGFGSSIDSQVANLIFKKATPSVISKIKKGGVAFGIRWVLETMEEGGQGAITEAARQQMEKEGVDVGALLDVAIEDTIGAAGTTLLMTAAGTGAKAMVDRSRKKITGHDGGPLTSDDVQTLKRQPDIMENLADSEEADLLRKAVNEENGSALAEYNQRLVGVEEVKDAVPVREAEEVLAREEAEGREAVIEAPAKEVEKEIAEVEEDAPVLKEKQTLELRELGRAMRFDKTTERIITDSEIQSEIGASPQFQQEATVEIEAPEIVDDVAEWENQQILYISKVLSTGAIRTEAEYNNMILGQELHDQSDPKAVWQGAKKHLKAVRSTMKAIEKKSAKAKISQKMFKPPGEMVLIDTAKELKAMYRRTIRDIETGRKKGAKVQKEKQKQLELKRDLLRNRAKRLIDIYVSDTKTKNQFKAQLDRVKGEKSLDSFFNRLHATIRKQQHSDSKTRLKKVLKSIGNTEAWIPRIFDGVELETSKVLVSKLSEKRKQKLERRKEFVAGEEEHLVPSRPIKELEKLDAEALADMEPEEIDAISDSLEKTLNANNFMIERRRNTRNLKMSNRKNSLNKFLDRRNATVKNLHPIAQKILDSKLLNHLRKAEFIIEEIDGTPGGNMSSTVLLPMREARNKEHRSGKPLLDELHKIAKTLPDDWFVSRRGEEVTVDGRTLPVGEVMGMYAHSKNNDNRKYMRRNNRFRSQRQIDSFISKLTNEERAAVDSVMELMDTQYEPMAEVAYNLTQHRPTQVDNYKQLSFRTVEGNAQFNDDNDLMKDSGVVNPYVSNGFTRERKGSMRELNLNFFGVAERHLMNVNRYIAFAETLKDVQNILGDKNIRASVDSLVGENATKELDGWLLRTANPNRRFDGMPRGVEDAAKWIRMRATVVNLGLNAVSSMAQFSSFPLTIERIGMRNAGRGVQTLLSDYKAKISNVNEKSAMMEMRGKSFDRDYKDFMQSRSVQAMFEGNSNLMNAYFYTLRSVDQFTAYSSWLGSYEKGLELYGEDGAAVRYADDVVEKTQPMADVMNLAAVQSGSELQKLFTPFYTAMSHVYNSIDTKTRGAFKKDVSFPEWLGSMFWMVVVPALWNHLIRNPDEEDLTDPKKIAVSHMNYLAGGIPVLGNAVSSLFNEYPYTPVPALDSVKYAGRMKNAIGKQDWGRATKNAAILSGFVYPWPSKQAVRTIAGASDLITGEADDLRRLIYSEYAIPKKKQSGGFTLE